jgi:hypothetical protein
VTPYAIGEVPALLLLVLLINLALIVLVAVVAGVGCVAIGMGGGARVPRAAMVHGESMGTIAGCLATNPRLN